MLKLSNITKSYLSGTSVRNVLDNLSLELNKGETIAIIGPSGSGKTTLLNIIGTLDMADSGEVIFNGNNLQSMSPDELSAFRNKNVGMVFQLHHLLPQCNVWENVLLPSLPLKLSDGSPEKKAEELLRQTGMWDMRFRKPNSLSGGECQRTAVVRALINNPELILADEPTGALDHENAVRLIDTLIELNNNYNTSLIVVTHSEDIASRMDKVYRLTDGKLMLQ